MNKSFALDTEIVMPVSRENLYLQHLFETSVASHSFILCKAGGHTDLLSV